MSSSRSLAIDSFEDFLNYHGAFKRNLRAYEDELVVFLNGIGDLAPPILAAAEVVNIQPANNPVLYKSLPKATRESSIFSSIRDEAGMILVVLCLRFATAALVILNVARPCNERRSK